MAGMSFLVVVVSTYLTINRALGHSVYLFAASDVVCVLIWVCCLFEIKKKYYKFSSYLLTLVLIVGLIIILMLF